VRGGPGEQLGNNFTQDRSCPRPRGRRHGLSALMMFFAPLPPGRFPFDVGCARLVVRSLGHKPLCSRHGRSPALVMCRVALLVSSEADLSVPHSVRLEEWMARVSRASQPG
jgi:hypothetical protein